MTNAFKFGVSLLCRASFPATLEESGEPCIVEVTVYRLNAVALNLYLLDGDEVRELYDRELGYTEEDREAIIKRIILRAYLLDRNDIVGIVCNISPLERLRELARRKIPGYNEIYLKKDLGISMRNDVKGMYRANAGKTRIVGIDATFDEPRRPDLVLEVDKQTEEETFQAVVGYIAAKYGSQYGERGAAL